MTEIECIALKIGMFLFYAGPVRPTTQTTTEENGLVCSGPNNQSYVCESGHCCGVSHCCSHFYELWWFWLVWVIIILLSFCCICHHRRSKHRLQQQQRQHEINLIAYREARSYANLPFYFRFLPNYLLPEYEEVVNRPPTPPPPYCALNGGQLAATSPLMPEQPVGPLPPPQTNPVLAVSDTRSSRPSLAEPDPPVETSRKAEGKAHASVERLASDPVASAQDPGQGKPGDPETEQLTDSGPEDKDKDKDKDGAAGRHRRFTGDSGIEVCVCVGEPGAEEHRELLGDFCHGCDSCSRRADPPGAEEQAPDRGPDHGAAPLPRAPVSLLLHTISEQEGSHQPGNPGPQS
ncbi:WW domain binding protein 1-like b isoform X1 [Conger conger]|uniref:WW domain binding protein 1-like b isoform X1 n=1 Tax=Conger conger TaxID=82655 RepID=UPI002A5A1DEB|nr:WW domain binding protein 1-like b isoform X1 [Conger conger]